MAKTHKKEPSKASKSSNKRQNSNNSDVITIPVEDIYFTHSKVYPSFSGCGKKIVDTIDEILDGKITAKDLPMITVHPCSSNPEAYFSLNNRRLYVFKELMKMGRLNTIDARLKPLPSGKRNADRYTEEKCSKSCKIMKERKEKVDGEEGDEDAKNEDGENEDGKNENGKNDDDDKNVKNVKNPDEWFHEKEVKIFYPTKKVENEVKIHYPTKKIVQKFKTFNHHNPHLRLVNDKPQRLIAQRVVQRHQSVLENRASFFSYNPF